ncbi:hypothetical protein Poli38472_006852 [Pythium oligandrum]|uniref:DJ-1/PfpI domain-containing protein n=1 Tax=Pythium oligandrum TaxID=41045 RepID=A0A8K1C5E0_PYTOL|nr:hypothetical protein Poli38472_006852 [Pythium oligandrum]|eukprot:TMW56842.1 hypothetical protein Poli38472_006852 [Pythium oligandrum]
MAGIVDTFANIVTPKPNALMPVANGSEEIEVAALTDILARGGVRVIIADVDGDEDHVVTLAKGLELQADKTIFHCGDDNYDLIVVPGGPGAKTLGDCSFLVDMIRKQKAAGRWFGGICAGPVDVLFRHALVTGPMTCFPGYKDQVGDLYRDQPVVVSDNCVTSQGPGTAVAMGLKLVEVLRSTKIASNLANDLVYRLEQPPHHSTRA